MKTQNHYLNEVPLMQEARELADTAKRAGVAYAFMPVAMLEALIEKATRPHD